MATTIAATFTTTHRVSTRIHRRAASRRPNPLPAVAASLPDLLHIVFDIANATNRRLAGHWHTAHFNRWQRDLRPILYASIQHRSSTSRTAHFRSATRHQLNVVNRHAKRNLV